MNNIPKPSGDYPKSRAAQQSSQNSGSSQTKGNSNSNSTQNNKNANNNNRGPTQNNGNKRRQQNQGSNNSANSKTYLYVRKADTQDGQEEQRLLQQKREEEERLKQEELRQQQLEEEERLKQLEIERQKEAERLLQEEQVKIYIQEEIIQKICADAEMHALQRKYLKSFEGLSYLLSTNFSDFEDVVSANIPQEIDNFNQRVYEAIPAEHNFRRRHQTSYNNHHSKYDEQCAPNNQNPSGQRITVRQRLNNLKNNKAQNSHNNNYNNADFNQRDYNEDNGRYQHQRSKKNTVCSQDNRADDENDSKWRQIRAPVFSQSKDELKFLLNVLTPDNFNNLKDEFYQICSRDVEKCINSLIVKVCKEAKYTKLYAQLTIYVKDREEENEKQNKTPTDSSTSEAKSFKAQMFASLQDFFYDQKKLNSILTSGAQNTKSQEAEDNASENAEDDDGSSNSHEEFIARKRYNTFLKFLGELFLSKFLPKKIISYIVQIMLQQYVYQGLKAEDKNLEGIITLIDSIGSEYEDSWKNSPSRQIKTDLSFLTEIRTQFNQNKNYTQKLDASLFENSFISFEGIMKILVFLTSTDKISIRIRSLITNLIERWGNKWEKVLHQKENPQTLQELRSQHYDELNKRQQEVEEHFSNYTQRSTLKYQKVTRTTTVSSSSSQSIDYVMEVKKVFSDLDKQSRELDDCISHLNKLGITNTLNSLFSSFFDTRLENLQQRYMLMNAILSQTQQFQKQTFLQSLNSVLNSLYSQACDFPHLNESFVSILCPLIMNSYLDLSQLTPSPCGDPDEDEDKNYFFQELKNDCTSFLKSINYFMYED